MKLNGINVELYMIIDDIWWNIFDISILKYIYIYIGMNYIWYKNIDTSMLNTGVNRLVIFQK